MACDWGIQACSATTPRRLVILIVLKLGKPLFRLVIVGVFVSGTRRAILDHQFDVFVFEVLLQGLHHRLLRIVELGPHFDTEHILTLSSRLVEQANTTEHVCAAKLVSHDAEDELLPDRLQERDAGLEVDSELSSVFVDRVFPLRLNVLLEKTEAVDAHPGTLHLHTVSNKDDEL